VERSTSESRPVGASRRLLPSEKKRDYLIILLSPGRFTGSYRLSSTSWEMRRATSNVASRSDGIERI
jgi:hypothetical protein